MYWNLHLYCVQAGSVWYSRWALFVWLSEEEVILPKALDGGVEPNCEEDHVKMD